MTILLDTNILLRLFNAQDELFPAVNAKIQELKSQGAEFVLAPQVVYEYWSVTTRPATANGWGLSPSQVASDIRSLLSVFPCQPDPTDLVSRWLSICGAHQVSGKNTHDARLGVYGWARHQPFVHLECRRLRSF